MKVLYVALRVKFLITGQHSFCLLKKCQKLSWRLKFTVDSNEFLVSVSFLSATPERLLTPKVTI